MKRVYLMSEGQTEETFVRKLLYPHLLDRGICSVPILFRTSRDARDGIVSYGKVRTQILRKCREDPAATVTTLIDLYGLPRDFPGWVPPGRGTPYDRTQQLEDAFGADIGENNFLPHLTVHKFEALLFSQVEAFATWCDHPNLVDTLAGINRAFESPEHINDGPETAPSKRILYAVGDEKCQNPLHSPLIAMDIGLDHIRKQCLHFAQWLTRIETLASDD